MYNDYWNQVWNTDDLDEYRNYIEKYEHIQNDMIDILKKHRVKKVCDAACGFGANSLALYSNGFNVYGFDISQASVDITTSLLSEYGLKESRFKKADIMNTGYSSELFDAVTARAVLDHLNAEDFKKALSELQRITRKNGLIYASFDPLEDEDLILEHKTLADGSLLYTDASREGLLFHYYTDDELQDIFRDYSVLMFTKDNRGNRHIVFQVEK